MERQRKVQGRHLALLSSDAPVMNRCAKEETHLKQRLAQSTAALTRSAQQNQAAAEREECARDAHLHAQFTAILSATPDIAVPAQAVPPTATAAAAAARAGASSARLTSSGPTGSSFQAVNLAQTATASSARPWASAVGQGERASPPITSSSSPACLLGFPEPYATSGFKSTVHWASVAYDETFLTAYGPRRLREEAQAVMLAEANGHRNARDARPHRLMAAVACYLLNEVLCADATVSALWQEKLRQPIFDAVFSSQSILAGQEKRKAFQSPGKAGSEAARTQTIVQHTLGDDSQTGTMAATRGDASSSPPHPPSPLPPPPPPPASPPMLLEPPFPPRTNAYVAREDFASMRLWTEEVAAEQREKAIVCRRVRSLQAIMERRMHLLQTHQRKRNEANLKSILTAWRNHTQRARAHRAAVERYLEKRQCRTLEENVFLRWRRVMLQTKVETLQRRVLNIVAEREEAARQHAADLVVVQEQLVVERRRNQQSSYEQDALHTQILESHSMEVEALRLVLHQQRMQTAEVGRWARRWERLAKTFRPSQQCPAVPPPMWLMARALHASEEAMVATVLGKGGDRRVLQQMPYSMVLPVRERLERLLLSWVNAVMEKSPLASSWVTLETFMHGRSTQPRSILVSQKADPEASTRSRASTVAAPAVPNRADSSYLNEFGVYTLMAFIRELRRLYILSGRMVDPDGSDSRQLRSGNGGSGGGRNALARCFREVVQLLSVQTCSGLYPSLLTHCPSLSRWFSPDGIFGGPIKSFEGVGKERRLQHTMFVWLLTSLLVGHIRLTVLAPAGERDDGLPPPPLSAASMQCTREAELDRIPQINFPVEGLEFVREAEASPAVATGVTSRGSSVVAQSTVLSKKASNATSRRPSKFAAELARDNSYGALVGDMSTFFAAEVVPPPAAAVTLETALRERIRRTGGAALDVGDPLSDIEAYLGLLSTQARSLRNAERRKGGSAGDVSAALSTATNQTGEGTDDDLVNGLLQQLVEARDVAAQKRRLRRMQHPNDSKTAAAVNEDGVSSGSPRDASLSFTGGSHYASDPNEDGEGESGHDPSARVVEGRTAAVLTEGQLRILRSLPARSLAFDEARAVPVESKTPSVTGTTPDATTPTPGAPAPSGTFYSFLLNTMEDVTRRQRWAGLARVVTSLVVRFHIIDDVEDGVQRSTMVQAAVREEEAAAAAMAHPLSSNTAAPSARLPDILSTAPAAKRNLSFFRQSTTNAGAMASVAPPHNRSRNQRVPARLVSSRQPQSPRAAEGRPSATAGSGVRVNVMSIGEELMRAATPPPPPAAQGGGSTTPLAQESAAVAAAAASRTSAAARGNALLSAYQLRTLRGEMSAHGQHSAKGFAAHSASASVSTHKASTTPLKAALMRVVEDATYPPPAPATKVISLASSLRDVVDAGTPLGTEPSRGRCASGIESEPHQMLSRARAGSADLSIASMTQDEDDDDDDTVDDVYEAAMNEAAGAAATARDANDGSLLMEAEELPHTEAEEEGMSPQAFPDGPSMSPPTTEVRRGTRQFSAPQSPVPSQHPTHGTPSSPPTNVSTEHQAVSLSPTQRPVAHSGPDVKATPQAPGAEGGGGLSVDGAPQGDLGYLDPLVEHGPPQPPSAGQGIQKYRFHMQP